MLLRDQRSLEVVQLTLLFVLKENSNEEGRWRKEEKEYEQEAEEDRHEVEEIVKEEEEDKDKKVVVYCKSGHLKK